MLCRKCNTATNILKLLLYLLFLLPVICKGQDVQAEHAPWEVSAQGYLYLLNSEKNYLNPIFTADKNLLHLEARYNYEEIKTASAFAGVNMVFGKKKQSVITPMAGIAFGETTGIIPALEIYMPGKLLEFYSEIEYFISTKKAYKNFFFNWSELGVNITDNAITGITAQVESNYEEKMIFDKGLYASYTLKNLTLSGYYFNPFATNYFFIAGVNFSF